MRILHEPSQGIPLVEEVDVLVAGGGPAGVAAAIAAAQAGASVRLIEQQGCLGGIWTAGLLTCIIDHHQQGGLIGDLIAELNHRGGTWPGRPGYFDPELMKLVLEERCAASGVRVRLHTRICSAHRDGDGRLAVVVTESASGREAWAAHAFVDASGGGDLAARAGCGFDLGRPEDGAMQPMSLLCLLAGPPQAAIARYVHDGSRPWGDDQDDLRALMAAGGADPSYSKPTLFPVAPGLYSLMANHEYQASGLDAQQVTEATMRARAEIHRCLDALRSAGGPWSGIRLVATAAHIGVREGRRIHGRYQVAVDDLAIGIRHPDPVCRVRFCIDVHALRGDGARAIESAPVRAKPYDIPLRALVAADCDGLLLAGRCISGDFLAHASYRVTGPAVAMGEAAGACAAVAARSGRRPHQVAWDEVAAVIPRLRELTDPDPIDRPVEATKTGPR